MIGSPNYIIGVYDADASSYPPTAPVPPGSIETEQVFRDYFAAIDQPVVDYQFSGRSDYQAFINNGVASGGLSTGSNGLKLASEAELFGGQAGVSYDYNYHSPADDISNVALDALDIQSDAIAHAVVQLGHDTSAVEPAAAKARAGVRLRRVPVADLGEVR
jgi:Zn-dependent M28 family amino/carboxypeptidase